MLNCSRTVKLSCRLVARKRWEAGLIREMATLIMGVEDGVILDPKADPGEERRLLYVAMTRTPVAIDSTADPTWARTSNYGREKNCPPSTALSRWKAPTWQNLTSNPSRTRGQCRHARSRRKVRPQLRHRSPARLQERNQQGTSHTVPRIRRPHRRGRMAR